MAAVASTISERLEFPPQQRPMDRSPSKSATDTATDSSASSTADVSEPNFLSFHSNSNKDLDVQSPLASKSEEYRQLFRLPFDEVLVEDFNCAFQENILIQGHMYLFVRYICFYSNIFGFETKKIIPFQEVTTVRKAKTAGIFPNAIEILAGSKKYFFASFLSRDEAFKLINDRWLQHDSNASEIADSQEIIADSSIHQDHSIEVESPKILADELDSAQRNTGPPTMQVTLDPSNFESDNISNPSETPVIVELVEEPIFGTTHASCSTNTWTWKEENSDAPKVPECFMKVAESKFPITVKDFFSLFFSDDAVDFIASFHEQCGDKDFKCSSWSADAKYGHARDTTFQHPIKIYFGAKCGSCHETQKLRLYKNSYMVIETSQDISDVPYSDYFSVEARWDVIKDSNKSNEGCYLRVYVNVAFSKKTLFKGKIVQSTMEECREAYATWINMAHGLLTRKNLEKREEERPADIIVEKGSEQQQVKEVKIGESSGRSFESSKEPVRSAQTSRSIDANMEAGNLLRETDTKSLTALLSEPMAKLSSILKSSNHLPYLLIIIFFVIFLMQLSIVMLLARPQHIHVSSPDQMDDMGGGGARVPEVVAWLEKRLHHLKDEMYMVESRLERMRHEHQQLSAQLKELDQLVPESNQPLPKGKTRGIDKMKQPVLLALP